MWNPLDRPGRRTLAGAVLAVSFVPVLLGITACLKTPIGDPEQGWVDPRISGIWLSGDPLADYSAALWVIEPYDRRTWLVTWLKFEDSAEPVAAPAADPATGAGPEPAPEALPDVRRILATLTEDRAKAEHIALYKVWMLSLSGRRFLVFEPKAAPSVDRRLQPELWIVVRVELAGDRMDLTMLDVSTDKLEDVKTRGEAEAIIARHAQDPDFYEEQPLSLYRVPQAAYDDAAAAIERTGLNR